jgi:hypothetical protein
LTDVLVHARGSPHSTHRLIHSSFLLELAKDSASFDARVFGGVGLEDVVYVVVSTYGRVRVAERELHTKTSPYSISLFPLRVDIDFH